MEAIHVLNELFFLAIIFLSNVIQGITGFAGTLLAMPFSMFLVSIGTAKAVMNLLGVSSGLQICLTSWSDVKKPILFRILGLMIPGMLAGYVTVGFLQQYESIQLLILGVFIFLIGLLNLCSGRLKLRLVGGEAMLTAVLVLAGYFHGMFVCGGALLVVYMTKRTPNKNEFRATISAIWLILNAINFFEHLLNGYFDSRTIELSAIAIPLVLVSVHLGGALLHRMSQTFFVRLTNVLLVLSGLSLILK
jgi:uncharacterized membrane protein YfcA